MGNGRRKEAPPGIAVVLGLLLLAIFAPAAFAGPADLDTSYSGDGLNPLFYNSSERTNDVVVQPDGKIITVGHLSNHWAIIRQNVNGSLDTSFDGDGFATTTFYADESFATAFNVALQTDGKIVVVGGTSTSTSGLGSEFAVARFNTNGSLDTTFSGDGMFAFGYACICDKGYGVAIQPDGKIIVAGKGGANNDMVAIRLLSNGSADTTFNGTGSVGVELGGTDTAYEVKVQSDGKVVLAGDSSASGGAVVRLTTSGILDSTFDGDGIKNLGTAPASMSSVQGLAIQSDGKLVVAGYSNDLVGARLTTAGALDTTYDGDGVFTIDQAGAFDAAWDVTLDQSGRGVFVGESQNDEFSPGDWLIARRNTNGTADATFNGGYRLIDFFFDQEQAYGVAIAPNGRIVIAGDTFHPSFGMYIGLARLLGDPPAPAPYPRPASATPLRIPLVLAYNQCTAPNSTHVTPRFIPGPGAADPACNPPVRTSTALTMSANGLGAGFVKLKAIVGNAMTPADEADISVRVVATDVRCASVSGCTAGNDYPFQLILRMTARITDGASDTGSATVNDKRIDIPFACTTTAGAAGSNCSITTTLDTMVPGAAPEGKLSIFDLPSIQLMDAGVDGTIGSQPCAPTCGNGDERTFATEGLFTP